MAKDESFQALLDAENQAERLIEEARNYRDELLEKTLHETRDQEARFEERIPEIRESALRRTIQHAEQVISDYQNRHDERSIDIREQAEDREQEALNSAFHRFLDSQG
jgi:vacuolar-type H+-ATPase subunit H